MEDYKLQTYLLMQNDFESRLASRSGGAFAALSDVVLKNNGVVYGCVLTDNFEVKHVRATTIEERDKMRGSKYVQSHLNDIFHQVKEDLKNGLQVLFSGTSCQCAGLKSYLGENFFTLNLIICDILCHGVPSERIFNSFLEYIEKTRGKKITAVDFRNKFKFGWIPHKESVTYNDGTDEDLYVFGNFFYTESVQRNSCRSCPYHSINNRPSDITLADAWGAMKENPELIDDNGISLILCNTKKGLELFKQVEDCFTKQIEMTDAYLEGPMSRNYDAPYYEDKLWKIFNTKGFESAYKFIKKESIKFRIKNKIRRILKLNVKEVKPRKKVNTKEDFYYQQYENIDKKDSKVVLPKIYSNKYECMGCTACYNKCLDIKQAITMKQDSKGFYYPVVDASKCVGCHSCENVCPYHKNFQNLNDSPEKSGGGDKS